MADAHARHTIDWLHTVVGDRNNRQVDFLTIHPRTRRTPSSTPINTESLSILLSTFGTTLPILLSGDVFTLDTLPFSNSPRLDPTFTTKLIPSAVPSSSSAEARETSEIDASLSTLQLDPSPPTPATTNLAGFMSARGLLANPALYAGHSACPWPVVESFLNHLARAPLPFKLALHHLNEMCGPGMGPDKSSLLNKRERLQMLGLTNMCDVVDFLDERIAEKTQRAGIERRRGDYGQLRHST
jgi:tRNA-dihydrouridine synthase 4